MITACFARMHQKCTDRVELGFSLYFKRLDRKNLQPVTSKRQYRKALELIAGYRSFPPVEQVPENFTLVEFRGNALSPPRWS